MTTSSDTVTLTWGDVCENAVGMQKIGMESDSGFTHADFLDLESMGKHEIYDLCKTLPKGVNVVPAHLLIIRGGMDNLVSPLHHHDLYQEMSALDWDTKFWDVRRKRVLNKRARYNLCFSNLFQTAVYSEGKGTVYSWSQLPILNHLRDSLCAWLGEKGSNLECEGNRYYNHDKCGIGLHGDTERKKVVGCRLGTSMNLCYQWFYLGQPVGEMLEVQLDPGDIYLMSEKAVGHDWKRRNCYTLRHCCGGVGWMKTVRNGLQKKK